MSTIGSVAAGSIIGHVVADKLLGGGSSEAQPQLEQAPMQQPCAQFKMNFDTCLFNNANQIYACQTNWEQYRACMQSMY